MLYDTLIMPRIPQGCWFPNVNEQTYDPLTYIIPLIET